MSCKSVRRFARLLSAAALLEIGCTAALDSSNADADSEEIQVGPYAPDSLTAMVISGHEVQLRWRDRSRIEIGFSVERGLNPNGPFSGIGRDLPANSTDLVDTPPSTSATYSYRVRAIGQRGASSYSNVASITLGGSTGGGSGSVGGGSGSVGGGSGSVGGGSGSVGGGSGSAGGGSAANITLSRLQTWTRNSMNPIFRGTGFAGDPHVWEESPGKYRMVYTDDVSDHQAIAMATSTNLVDWTRITNSQYPNGFVLQGAGPGGQDINLETASYRKAQNGKHQIFYIGYPDEATYHAAIYLAESDNVQGPYARSAAPVISWSAQGPDSHAMTSPTLVEHQGTLYMSYIGWQGFPDGPVNIVGATSTTDGRSWVKQGALNWDKIFGVEAHTEKGPDGLFYRVGVTGDSQGRDTFVLGRSTHPFGPYEKLPNPILTPAGAAVGEGDTIMSPSLLFVGETQQAYMHYAAVDTGGWPWVISVATCSYGP